MACSVLAYTTRTLHHIALFLFGSYGTAELRFFLMKAAPSVVSVVWCSVRVVSDCILHSCKLQ